jgi:ribosomal protein L11 methyltransferase
MSIGQKLLVKPSWSRQRPARGQAVVILDPGLSFGTGQHPTTRFCLEQLVKRHRAGAAQSVLDVGTGSGILAIAAAKLGYSTVHAFDFDPESVRVARQNAKVNGVTKKVQLSQADVTRLSLRNSPRYSVVCANLLANLLLAERARLMAKMTQDGVLVVAGILRREFSEVQQAYERAGLKLIARRIEKEWQSGTFEMAR